MSGQYRTIVADPPWPINGRGTERQREAGRSAFLPYASMTVDEIGRMPVAELAAHGAHVYIWTTNGFLWDTRAVLEAWGFTPISVLVWCKRPMGMGPGSAAFANSAEFVVWGRKRYGGEIRRRREGLGLSGAQLERELGVTRGLVARWEEDSSWPTTTDRGRLTARLGWEADFADGPLHRWDTTWFEWPRRDHSAKPDAFLDLVEQTSPGPYFEIFARRARLGWDYWGDQSLGTAEMPEASCRAS